MEKSLKHQRRLGLVGRVRLDFERVANDMRKPRFYRQEKSQLLLDAYDNTTHNSKFHDAMIT